MHIESSAVPVARELAPAGRSVLGRSSPILGRLRDPTGASPLATVDCIAKTRLHFTKVSILKAQRFIGATNRLFATL